MYPMYRTPNHPPRNPRPSGESVRPFVLACVALLLSLRAGELTVRASTIRADRDPQLAIDLAARPEYAAVGRLDVSVFEQGPPAVGSGTLVAPGWVLTAAHVLEGARAVQFTAAGETYSATRWVTYPSYNGDLVRGYDLALVQLDQTVVGIQPARLYTGRSEIGRTATFVGVGLTGTGLTGAVTDDRVPRAVTNTIDGTGRNGRRGLELQAKLPKKARHFVVDFDNPGNPADSRIGSPTPTDLEGLISRGDSGGAVFLDDPAGGSPFLAGVHSYGQFFDDRDDSDYGDVTGHTRVSTFAGWIDNVVAGSHVRKLRFVTPIVPSVIADGPSPMRLEPGETPVPEPSAGALVACLAAWGLGRRRHGRQNRQARRA